jgi:hypothetical protein
MVVLPDEPWLCFTRDLFGGLVVMAWRRQKEPMPTRLATLSDKRRAVLFDVSMIKRKRRTTNKQ